MVLEGVVTNVAAFGAFVDVGVHQDGLVHVSALSTTFVKDPRDVVKPGDVVRVKVLEVDVPRKRISLTLRLDDEVPAPGAPGERRRPKERPAERPKTAAAAAAVPSPNPRARSPTLCDAPASPEADFPISPRFEWSERRQNHSQRGEIRRRGRGSS